MTLSGVFENLGVGCHESGRPVPRRPDQEPVRRIRMEIARKSDRIQSDCRFDGTQIDTRCAERPVDPNADIHRQLQPSFHREQRDFPRGDRRYANPVRESLRLDASLGLRAEPRRTLDQPDQYMRVEDDHRRADQSSGEAAGSNGSSYLITDPRMLPKIGFAGSADGGKDTTATG